MPFNPIAESEIETGQPVDNALLTKIKVNLDDHKGRIELLDTLLDGSDPIDTIGARVLMDNTHVHQFATGPNVQIQMDNADAKLFVLHEDLEELTNDIQIELANDRYRLTQIEGVNVTQNNTINTHSTQIASIITDLDDLADVNTAQDTTLNIHSLSLDNLNTAVLAHDQSITDFSERIENLEDLTSPKLAQLTRYIVKTFVSGTTWYEINNDGWVRQSGRGTGTITLPIAMKDTNYYVNSIEHTASTEATNRAVAAIQSIATTTIGLYGEYTKSWIVEGYAAAATLAILGVYVSY